MASSIFRKAMMVIGVLAMSISATTPTHASKISSASQMPSAHQRLLQYPPVPPCVPKKKNKLDCTLQNLHNKILNASTKDLIAVHLYLANKTIQSGKYGEMAMVYRGLQSGNQGCIAAAREGMLTLLPKLNASEKAVKDFWKYVDIVNFAFDLASTIGTLRYTADLVATQGSKAASKIIKNEAKKAVTPDYKGVMLDIAKSLSKVLVFNGIDALIRGEYALKGVSGGCE